MTSWLRLATIGIPAWAVLHWSVAVFRGLSQTLPTFLFRDTLRPALLILLLIPGWYMGTLGITWDHGKYHFKPYSSSHGPFCSGADDSKENQGALRETGGWAVVQVRMALDAQHVASTGSGSLHRCPGVGFPVHACPGWDIFIGQRVSGNNRSSHPVNYLALPMLMTGRTGVQLGLLSAGQDFDVSFGLPLFLTFILWPKGNCDIYIWKGIRGKQPPDPNFSRRGFL